MKITTDKGKTFEASSITIDDLGLTTTIERSDETELEITCSANNQAIASLQVTEETSSSTQTDDDFPLGDGTFAAGDPMHDLEITSVSVTQKRERRVTFVVYNSDLTRQVRSPR